MSRTPDVNIVFGADFNQVRQSLTGIQGMMQGWANTVRSIGIAAFATWLGREAMQQIQSGLRAITGFVKGALGEAMEGRAIDARLHAVIQATGASAGRSVPQLKQMADELERITRVDDGKIKTVMGQVLAFPSVKGENFDRAIKAVLDTTALGFGTLESNALQLAKALEYPESGLDGLAKSGVRFTEEQKDMLKIMVQLGETAMAQRVILDAVEVGVKGVATATGGAGKAQADLTLGMKNFREQVGDTLLPWYDAFTATLGEKLIPILDQLGTDFANLMSKMNPDMVRQFAEEIAKLAGALGEMAIKTAEMMPFLTALAGQAGSDLAGILSGSAPVGPQGLKGSDNWMMGEGKDFLSGGFMGSALRMFGFKPIHEEFGGFTDAMKAFNLIQGGIANPLGAITGRPQTKESVRDAFVRMGSGAFNQFTNAGMGGGSILKDINFSMADLQGQAVQKWFLDPLKGTGFGTLLGAGNMLGMGATGSMYTDETASRGRREDAILQLAKNIDLEPFKSTIEDASSVFNRIQTATAGERDIPKSQLETQKEILKTMADQIEETRNQTKVEIQIRDKLNKGVVATAI